MRCLENFFGLICRKSLGDDHYIVAVRIIAKTSLTASVMHDLGISIAHWGRDNVGGVQISGRITHLVETEGERIFESLLPLPAQFQRSGARLKANRGTI
jgi:hypothetical protein